MTLSTFYPELQLTNTKPVITKKIKQLLVALKSSDSISLRLKEKK